MSLIREFATSSGPYDYALFINRQVVGVIEAKKSEFGIDISKVHEQTERYGDSEYSYVDESKIRFLYEATDIIINYSDLKDIDDRSLNLTAGVVSKVLEPLETEEPRLLFIIWTNKVLRLY